MTIFRTIAAALLLAVAGLVAAARQPPQVFTFRHEAVLGTSLDLKVVARTQATAERAEAAALAEIARQATILSAYDPESEFSRWARTTDTAVAVSPELYEVLDLFDRWRERTGGAINPAAEAASRLWQASAAESRLPTDAALASIAAAMQRTHWRLDPGSRTATRLSSVPLTLNSFTKSYIVEHAVDAALAAGPVRAVILNVGGDLVVRGDWTEPVRLADPAADAENSAGLTTIAVRGRAVATSGSYRRGVDIDGHHYSHIIDPRTGRPQGHVVSATVVAPDGATAGALATAFCVLAPEESRALAASLPGVEYLLVERDGAHIQSAAWQSLEPVPPPPGRSLLPIVHAAEQGTWDPAFELDVNLELARVTGFGGKRPYVAVWIEDQDRFPVRTLAVWFQKSRWLPDLKSWYRSDRMRAMAEGSDLTASVSSATRPAGKYTLKWDGKDNQGQPVKAGTYTVYIEAAREHGTYQIIRQAMDFSGKPQQLELPGNVEVAAATLDYHPRANR